PIDISFARTGGSISPLLNVFAPDGTFVTGDSDSDNAKVFLYAEQAGTYVVAVENGDNVFPELSGTYDLYYSNMLEEFTISEGDEGGPLQNGARTSGAIDTGDVDLWTFEAQVGDPINISFAEIGGNFSPYVIVFNPDGTTAGWDSDSSNARVFLEAEQAGKYVVSVENGNANAPELTGTYKLNYFNNRSNVGYVGFILSEGYPLRDSGFQDDLNRDGLSNGLAYALGMSLVETLNDYSPIIKFSETYSVPVLELQLPEQRPLDITYKVEFSTDLTSSWAPLATLDPAVASWHLNHESALIEADGDIVRIGLRNDQQIEGDLFLRLVVSLE
ncbi:pre-peptidase C-terminal domain-containing protein, partial [Pelagicoccus sp. NFK12]